MTSALGSRLFEPSRAVARFSGASHALAAHNSDSATRLAVVVTAADGVITDWNGHAEATFGWTRGEAVGRRVAYMILPPRLREAYGAMLRNYLRNGDAS